MPVKLIQEDERNKWTYQDYDAGFYFRRPTMKIQREIQARHTVKGITKNEDVVADLLEWAIFGWFGFVDKDGNSVAFDKLLLVNVPELMKAAFVTELYGASPEAAELGN